MADMGVHARMALPVGDPQPVSVYARIGTYTAAMM
jgi:hypothetical protein